MDYSLLNKMLLTRSTPQQKKKFSSVSENGVSFELSWLLLNGNVYH